MSIETILSIYSVIGTFVSGLALGLDFGLRVKRNWAEYLFLPVILVFWPLYISLFLYECSLRGRP